MMNIAILLLRLGMTAMYINLTNVFEFSTITEADYDGRSCAIRSAVISEKAKVLTILFYELSKMACNDTMVKVTLMSSSDAATRKVFHKRRMILQCLMSQFKLLKLFMHDTRNAANALLIALI